MNIKSIQGLFVGIVVCSVFSLNAHKATTGMYVLNAVPEPSIYLTLGFFFVVLIWAAIHRKQVA